MWVKDHMGCCTYVRSAYSLTDVNDSTEVRKTSTHIYRPTHFRCVVWISLGSPSIFPQQTLRIGVLSGREAKGFCHATLRTIPRLLQDSWWVGRTVQLVSNRYKLRWGCKSVFGPTEAWEVWWVDVSPSLPFGPMPEARWSEKEGKRVYPSLSIASRMSSIGNPSLSLYYIHPVLGLLASLFGNSALSKLYLSSPEPGGRRNWWCGGERERLRPLPVSPVKHV